MNYAGRSSLITQILKICSQKEIGLLTTEEWSERYTFNGFEDGGWGP